MSSSSSLIDSGSSTTSGARTAAGGDMTGGSRRTDGAAARGPEGARSIGSSPSVAQEGAETDGGGPLLQSGECASAAAGREGGDDGAGGDEDGDGGDGGDGEDGEGEGLSDGERCGEGTGGDGGEGRAAEPDPVASGSAAPADPGRASGPAVVGAVDAAETGRDGRPGGTGGVRSSGPATAAGVVIAPCGGPLCRSPSGAFPDTTPSTRASTPRTSMSASWTKAGWAPRRNVSARPAVSIARMSRDPSKESGWAFAETRVHVTRLCRDSQSRRSGQARTIAAWSIPPATEWGAGRSSPASGETGAAGLAACSVRSGAL